MKNRSHKNKHCHLVHVDRLSSIWIADCGDSLILSNNCVSVSSGVPSVHLVLVLAERGIHAAFWAAAFPESPRQLSLAAGRTNSSLIIKTLALAIFS